MSAAILYSSDLATVYQGDALDVLPTLDTESLDLVVMTFEEADAANDQHADPCPFAFRQETTAP